jgi:hypothetical protein
MTMTTDDYGNAPATAGLLVPGAITRGAFEAAYDVDWFQVALQAGTTYLLRMTPDGGHFNYLSFGAIYLELYDAQGARIDTTTAIRTQDSVVLEFTPRVSGSYYLAGDVQMAGPAGAYAMTAEVQAPDDVPDGPSTTAVLPVGGQAGATFERVGDRDWFKFHAEVGQHIGFGDIISTAGMVAPGPLRVYDAAGAMLHQSSAPFEALTAGDYYLSVEGQQAGAYTLTAALLEDDYSANDSSPGNLAVGVQASGRMQYTGDIDRMRVDLQAGVAYVVDLTGNPAYVAHMAIDVSDGAGGHLAASVQATAGGGLRASFVAPSAGSYGIDISNGAAAGTGVGVITVRDPYTVKVGVDDGLPPPAHLSGGPGNDRLDGSGNGSVLDGGAGIDTALYGGSASHYTVQRSGGQVTVAASGAATPDTLTGIERLHFSDADIALDIDGHGGQAYRLYQAAFGRAPDLAGVGYWIDALDRGASLRQVADGFAGSAEFHALYGDGGLSDAQFVDRLYLNVLHRHGEADGLDYWLGQVHNGAQRADLVLAFSESAENQAALAGVIGNGFAYTPLHA